MKKKKMDFTEFVEWNITGFAKLTKLVRWQQTLLNQNVRWLLLLLSSSSTVLTIYP